MGIQLTLDDRKDIVNMSAEHSQKYIAEWIGCSRGTIRKVQRLYGLLPHGGERRKWTEEESQTLIDLIDKDHSSYFIGQVLDRSKDAVNVQVSKLRKEGRITKVRQVGVHKHD